MKKSIPYWGLAVLWFFFVAVEIAGVDYGLHWDEDKLVKSIQWSVDHSTILPNSYLYPSFTHTVGLLTLGTDVAKWYYSERPLGISLREHLLKVIGDKRFLIRMRLWTILGASLSLFWIFGASRAIGGNPWEGLLAAGLLGLSWEVTYHARWFTVDPWLLNFGALTLFFLCLARTSTRAHLWFFAAAVAAGLAAGTKQTGVLLLPGVLMLAKKNRGILIAVFIAVFLLTTPGIFFQPTVFFRDALFHFQTYGHLGNDAYTVRRGGDHLWRMIDYLGLSVFSRFSPLAFFVSLLVVFGAICLWKRDRVFALGLFIFPVLLVGLFSAHVVMIVRNLLVLVPLLAFLAGRGFFSIRNQLGKRPGLVPTSSYLLLFVLLSNGIWNVYAAWTIRLRTTNFQVWLLSHYLDDHSQFRFLLSPRSAEALSSIGYQGKSFLTMDPRNATDFTVFSSGEAGKRFDGQWPANRRGYIEAWFGPYEVNLDYYPTWLGEHRFVVMKTDRALKTLGPPSRFMNGSDSGKVSQTNDQSFPSL